MKWICLACMLVLGCIFGNAQTYEQGAHSDALIYSVHHDTVALAINFGNGVDQNKRQRVLNFIDQNIFSGDYEIPIKCFVGPGIEGDGVITTIYISGDWYEDLSKDQRYFNLTELNNQAVKIAGVFNLLQGKY